MRKMTKKQQAAIDARNAAKVFEIEKIDATESVFQILPATDCYPEGRKIWVGDICPNYSGSGKPLCVYLPEPDPVVAYQGTGIILGGFAESREEALEKFRTLYTD